MKLSVVAVRNIVAEFEEFSDRFVVRIYYDCGDKIILRNELKEKQHTRLCNVFCKQFCFSESKYKCK